MTSLENFETFSPPPRWVHALFCVAIVAFVVGSVVTFTLTEPYPALVGPAFGNPDRGGFSELVVPNLSATDGHGDRHVIRTELLFPHQPTITAQKLLWTSSNLEGSAAQAWLCSKLAASDVRSARAFDVSWKATRFDLGTGDVVHTYIADRWRVQLDCQ